MVEGTVGQVLLPFQPQELRPAGPLLRLGGGEIVRQDKEAAGLQGLVQLGVQRDLLRLGEMVQGLHGHRGVEGLLPQGHVEIGPQDQVQRCVGKLFSELLQHPGGQVDARDAGRGNEFKIVPQLQARAAAQIEDRRPGLLGQLPGVEGIELGRVVDGIELVRLVPLDPGIEEIPHLFQHICRRPPYG